MTKRASTSILIILVFSLMISFTGCTQPSKERQTVEIFSGVYEDRIESQLAYLKKQCPDIDVNITCLASGKIVAKIISEGKDTTTDVVVGLGSAHASTLKSGDMLIPFDVGLPYRAEFNDVDNVLHPTGVYGGAIFLNTREMERYNLPEPKSYEDLLDPIYKGHIVMCNPQTSGTGYIFFLGLLNLYGIEDGWAYLDKLHENISFYGESGSVPTTMISKGEAAIGLGMDYDGLRLQDSGAPVKVIFPIEGIPYDYENVLLVKKGSEPSKAAIEIAKAIAQPSEDNPFCNMYKLPVYVNQTNTDDRYDGVKLLDMSGITDVSLKEHLLNEWIKRYE